MRANMLLGLLLSPAVAAGVAAAADTVPDLAALRAMTARFAPVDIAADISKLPANERAGAGASWWRPRGSWTPCSCGRSGPATSRCCSSSWRDDVAARPRAPALLPDQQGPVVAPRPQRAVRARASPAKPRGRQLLSRGRDQGGGGGLDEVAARGRAGGGASGFFTTIRRGPDGGFIAVPYSLEYQGELARAAELLREAAALTRSRRSRPSSRSAPTPSSPTTTTTSDVAWMELDAAHRADHRPLRGVRGRVVQLQGGVRGVHHRPRRRRDREAGAVRRPSCRTSRTTCPSIPRCAIPKLGAPRAHPRGQRRLLRPATRNRGVQTAAYNLPNDERVVAREGLASA